MLVANDDKLIGLLQINDSYATLVAESTTELTFRFVFHVNRKDVLRFNTTSVRVSVFESTNVPVSAFASSSDGSTLDPRQLISNVLSATQDAKTTVATNLSRRLVTQKIDLTSRLNNSSLQITDQAPTRVSFDMIVAGDSQEDAPLLEFTNMPAVDVDSLNLTSYEDVVSRSSMELVTLHNTDPSSICELVNRTTSAFDATQGTSHAIEHHDNDLLSSLLDRYNISDPLATLRTKASELVPTESYVRLRTDSSDDIGIVEVIKFPNVAAIKRQSTTFPPYVVRFELLRDDNVVEQVDKRLQYTVHHKYYVMPLLPPTVGVAHDDNVVTLSIRQRDKKAMMLALYEREVSTSNVDDYRLIKIYNLKYGNTLVTSFNRDLYKTMSYRAIPVGINNLFSHEYTNVVVHSQRSVNNVVIMTSNVTTGVKVEIAHIPFDVTSAAVCRRNVTLNEQTYALLDDSLSLVDDQRTVSYVDTNTSQGNVYEYACRLTCANGLTKTTGHSLHERIPRAEEKNGLDIRNTSVSAAADDLDVSFDIVSTFINNNIDTMLELLDDRGLRSYFDDDVLKERSFLTGLFAFNVTRTNMMTGQVEDYGVTTKSTFVDSVVAKNNSVSELQRGHKYRYTVSLLLRETETLLTQLTKTKTTSTGTEYTFNPLKFLHPVLNRHGMLVSAHGLDLKFAKDQFMYGALGVTSFIDVSFEYVDVIIKDLVLARFNEQLNVITWSIDGDVELLDHVLVFKNVHGVRTLVGKTHTQSKQFKFMHVTTKHDTGQFVYELVPVSSALQEYRPKTTYVTNTITI